MCASRPQYSSLLTNLSNVSCLENLSKVSTSCKIFNSPERLVFTIQHSATERLHWWVRCVKWFSNRVRYKFFIISCQNFWNVSKDKEILFSLLSAKKKYELLSLTFFIHRNFQLLFVLLLKCHQHNLENPVWFIACKNYVTLFYLR